jgi:hypothetical protein
MSTMKIREALDRLSEEHGEGAVREAMKEVDAIERAADDFTESDAMDEVAIDTVSVFERIARERYLRETVEEG